MKKLFMMVVALGVVFTALAATDGKSDESKLPEKSRDFLHKYFPRSSVESVAEDASSQPPLWWVQLSNGDRVSFDHKSGECMSISLKQGSIPMAMVPEKVRSNVESHYPGATITSISRAKDGIHLGLNNGKSLCYDKDGNIVQMGHGKQCDKSQCKDKDSKDRE